MWRREAALATLALLAACDPGMVDQPKHEPLEASPFFADGRSARPRVPGTVARGRLKLDEHLHAGRAGAAPAETFPFAIARPDLRRGRERFEIFCAPCHDAAGTGDGMIVRHGFRRPPSLHEERLRAAPVGRIFDAITAGFGAMPGQADKIAAEDRWRIVAYVRALQLSQHAMAGDLPEADRRRLP